MAWPTDALQYSCCGILTLRRGTSLSLEDWGSAEIGPGRSTVTVERPYGSRDPFVELFGNRQGAFELPRLQAGHPRQEPAALELKPVHLTRLKQPDHHPLVDHRRGEPAVGHTNLEEPVE